MNDLLRPSLYGAFHKISKSIKSSDKKKIYDVVGPICETGDVIGYDVEINGASIGDILVVHSAGAYGAVMGSNYNSRPKIPEILISGDKAYLIREKESINQILQNEVVLEDE